MAQQMPVSGAAGGEKMAAPLRNDSPATSIHVERARRELLRAAMDAVEEWVVVVDAQGGIQFLNAPYAEFLGVEASEVLGRSDKTIVENAVCASLVNDCTINQAKGVCNVSTPTARSA